MQLRFTIEEGEQGEEAMPGATDLNAPQSDGRVRASRADSFARFCQVAATQPEKLRHLPALAKELGIAESTAYKYRQRFAQLQAEAETVRSGPHNGTSNPLEPPSAAQPPHGMATVHPPIPVLTLEPGPNAIPLNLKQLVRSRMLIQASSSGGKSHALRYLLELTHSHIQQFVIDPEGEFSSLRESFPFIVAGRDGDVPADPSTAALLCRRLMSLNVSAVLDLYDLAPGERRRFVRLFLEELLNLPRADWHPVLVAIDEAHVYAPEKGKGEAESTEAVITLCTQGRKRGLAPILATQRLAKLHKDAAAELGWQAGKA
jgi:hypothetical protein